ncbi:LTA synthase family protein [Anaerosacchariphilus polymeriproducens]|uniref:Alkaline phosphatase family protein n=1 Tax=Anaerosacchariphilus polymeriproducens TaxID=1812858 RepID=A0A371B0A0_9FIRM|nr:alkaline phosphatase family protein [Anaerosacchariphilus polymeriproducens]RDU25229.1 alkaline phosphatase family protein [Anaerosacchariphilus polymeriproducens]
MREVKDKFKKIIKRVFTNSFAKCGMVALVLDYIIEILSRHSILNATKFVIGQPFTFICNVLIIMLTLLVALLFQKRIFVMAFISCIWLAFGITNCVLLTYRITPFSVVDFRLFDDALSVIDKYCDSWSVVLIAIGGILFLAGIILLWIRTPKVKERIQYIKVALYIVAWGGLTFLVTDIGVQAQAISSNNENIADFYETNGFVYCFSSTLIDNGIAKPGIYSEDKVDELLESSNKKKSDFSKKPNIIMVQLESFFDVNYLSEVKCSKNPVSIFENLKKNYTSGFLTVPVVGAGTANTEFEVLTGMNLDYFGTGEYPYKTVLRQKTCESLSYNLKNIGYGTHAIHNNDANFYGRNTVFSNLGFDSFTSVEYMQNVEKNPIGWAKDKVLKNQILDALKSTKGQDFVYTIAVQSHGQYPSEKIDEKQKISIEGLEGDKKNQYEYYINQVYEVDQFVGKLIKALEKVDEDTVLVLYGDHLPNIGMKQEDIKQGNLFQTEYVIWDNFSLGKKDRDLEAYQLSAYVQDLIGYHEGTLTKYHQRCAQNADYQEGLEVLEYDILYGDKFAYGGESPFDKTDLKMGVKDIKIDDVQVKQDKLYVKGKNFTESSVVYINDKKQDTEFVDNNTLAVEGTDWELEDSTIAVSQVNDDKVFSTVEFNKPSP